VVLSAWRIVKRKYQEDAFSGEGSRKFGGRWNSPGLAMVYTAESQSLAALEMLVHLEAQELLAHYVVFQVSFEKALVKDVDTPLPKGWDAEPVPRSAQAVGDQWCREAASAILRVPSAIVLSENNYLLNPRHRQFDKVEIATPAPFRVHHRLRAKLK